SPKRMIRRTAVCASGIVVRPDCRAGTFACLIGSSQQRLWTDMNLFFSRNPNPRLAVATARHLQAKVEFEFAAPFAPGQAERFRSLNPNLSIPILEGSWGSLWE